MTSDSAFDLAELLADPVVASHVSRALDAYIPTAAATLARNGVALPSGLVAFRNYVSPHLTGQDGTRIASSRKRSHDRTSTPNPPRLLTKAQAAHELGISTRQLNRIIRRDQIVVIYLGPRSPRLRREDIDHLAAQGR